MPNHHIPASPVEVGPADAAPRKPRHDAFDGERRKVFLDALGKCGCLRDAARKAGVSHQTVYNHQASDNRFARQCELALDMASTTVELQAWERGVVGVEEPIVYRGEVIGTRLKRSDSILRMLLMGSNRKKYGANPGFTRRRLHKLERKRIEQDVRAQFNARRRTDAEIDRDLRNKLDKLAMRINAERIEQGYINVGVDWIPPGWVRADGQPVVLGDAHGPQDGGEKMPDSV